MQLAARHVTVNSPVNPPVCPVLLRTGDPPPLACSSPLGSGYTLR